MEVTVSNLEWTPEGPRSARFGDVYFSREDGLAESRAVFLAGCGLPDAWAGRVRFTVAELGFGTGLNIAALLELWRTTRPAGGRLHIFSIEAYPLTRNEAERALGAWPELAAVAAPMLDRWPDRAQGFHRIDFPEFKATLDLAIGDVAWALQAWSGHADAWFLDGFSPATNPEMWRDDVMALIAARSAPGARLATFTVAGAVRRSLAAQGFTVDKRPGFARKRERLEARLPHAAAERSVPAKVAIIGAGIAGAAMARALAVEGIDAVVVEAVRPGASASGNRAALVTPRLDAGAGPLAALAAQALTRAAALYAEVEGAVIAKGVLQLEGQDRDSPRFDKIAAQPIWPEGAVTRLDRADASQALGEPTDRGALDLSQALVIEPAQAIAAWLGATPLVQAKVAQLDPTPDGWSLLDGEGQVVLEAQAVVLAAGHAIKALAPELDLRPVRGQTSTAAVALTSSPCAWGGYLIPTRDGLLFGATHDRGDTSDDVREADHARNLATLAKVRPELATALADQPLDGRAAVRATTPDRLPVCGDLRPGLFVLGGLGSRGFSFAPLLAEHLASRIGGAPSPIACDAAALFDPLRFVTTAGA